jgi:hypothetical protein
MMQAIGITERWLVLEYIDARDALRCLQKWRGTHVKRDGNRPSHRLAKEALLLNEEYVILEETPCVFFLILYLLRYCI